MSDVLDPHADPHVPDERRTEQPGSMPPFGPPFVRFVHDRLRELDQKLTILAVLYSRRPKRIRVRGTLNLDASGNGTVRLVPEVQPGFTLRLHRLTIRAFGYTFGVPYTSATGYLEIQRNAEMEDGIAFTSPGLPRIWSAGNADGIEFAQGEQIMVQFFTGPASTSVAIVGEGTLQPFESQ